MLAIPLRDLDAAPSVDGMEVGSIDLGGMAVAHYRLQRGFDSTPLYRGLPHGMCPCTHWVFLISGRLRVRTATGRQETIEAGSVFHVEAGHLMDILEDTEMIEFTPAEQYRAKSEHLAQAVASIEDGQGPTSSGSRATP